MTRLTWPLVATIAIACGSDGVNTVDPPPTPIVASVAIVPATLALQSGLTGRLNAEARDMRGAVIPHAPITWTTSAPAVATVGGEGTVTALAGGQATIVATSGGKSAAALVTVEDVYDLASLGPPRILTHDYIEASKVFRVSRFRSGIGHDYADEAERCRSMKHYFQPAPNADWSGVVVFSPVAGTVVEMQTEMTFGVQLRIRTSAVRAMTVIVFHVRPHAGIEVGSQVAAHQRLGTHIGSQTMSDIAIRVQTPTGFRFVSYFEVMSDALFATYQTRGISTRQSAIISAAERDAAPLSCDGERFESAGALVNWVQLQ
jgi:hypothetical protein